MGGAEDAQVGGDVSRKPVQTGKRGKMGDKNRKRWDTRLLQIEFVWLLFTIFFNYKMQKKSLAE